MKHLENITLISVCGDSRYLIYTIKAALKCMEGISFKSVKILSNILVSCTSGIEIVKIDRLNQEQYSHFCLYELMNYVDTEYVLNFQWDGFVINPQLWNDEFLQFDYIGAPWIDLEHKNVGNGGFSLRSQRFLHSASKLTYNKNIQFQNHTNEQLVTPEDWFVCAYSHDKMVDMGVKFADMKLAYTFSVEHPSIHHRYNRFDLATYKSFGFHGAFNAAAMNTLKRV